MTTDITFCGNDTCPIRRKCKRGSTPPGVRSFTYFDGSGKECEFFLPLVRDDGREWKEGAE